MIPRYSSPQVDELFSETAKMTRWLEIELAVAEEMEVEGIIPAGHAKACRAAAPTVDTAFVTKVEEREAVTNHDVAAFVDTVQAAIGAPAGVWIHYGLTSTDVVDTGLCWALRDAAGLVISAQTDLLKVLVDTARSHASTPMIGRTHGIHAEPTTFGAKVALWALQVERDRQRMKAARDAVSVCKLSGAVGTYSNIPPSVEERVAKRLGLVPVPATQVIARDRHAEYLWACASAGTTLEMIAVELRHLQRTEVNEVREGFAKGQKGSSAMPHKRNPISAETISGLSRVLRGNLQVGLQDVPLWHERDISHSSAERIVLPDSTSLVFYMTRRMASLVSNLEIDTARMQENLDSLHGVVYSQSVLLAMVDAGMLRDEAYRIVQECAAESISSKRPLRDVLAADKRTGLSAERLDAAFDPARVLAHASRGIAALDAIVL